LTNLNDFLKRTKEKITRPDSEDPLTVVMGGPAADPDSLFGSLAYACLLGAETASKSLVIALVPIPRSDLGLRPEILFLLQRCGVDAGDLLFADDLDLVEVARTGRPRLVLVDTQGRELEPCLRECVVEVIDHHKAEIPGERLERFTVEQVGSACTLVGEQILRRKPEILDRELATLLLAALLLDTANLDPRAGRVTARDGALAASLTEISGTQPARLYSETVAVQQALPGLGFSELLYRDFKQGQAGKVRYGLSSIPFLLDGLREREEHLGETIVKFLAGQRLDLLLVLLYRRGAGFRRQLIACAGKPGLLRSLVAFLQGKSAPRASSPVPGKSQPSLDLGLRELPLASAIPRSQASPSAQAADMAFFEQSAVGISRKDIEPELRMFLESV